MTGSLQKMHAQLRRLRNDSSILKDAYITAIPNHKSKVKKAIIPETFKKVSPDLKLQFLNFLISRLVIL